MSRAVVRCTFLSPAGYSSTGCRSLGCRLSHAYVHIALEHSAPERVEATFCSAGRTVRIGLVVGGLGVVPLAVSCSYPYQSSSREAGARFLCVRFTQCSARGGRQRDYATTRHQRSTRSGEAPKGKGGMHEGERACGPDSRATRAETEVRAREAASFKFQVP